MADLVTGKVEIRYGGDWHDITADALDRGVSITRGVPDEGGRAAPGTLSLSVNNGVSRIDGTLGRYSPRNPRSPLYGLIGRNTPIRVSAALGSDPLSARFVGEVVEWPPRWDVAEVDLWVPLRAAGILRRLGIPGRPLRSAPARFATALNPVGYWPLDDPEGATVARSGIGGPPLKLSRREVTGDPVELPLWSQGTTGQWLPPAVALRSKSAADSSGHGFMRLTAPLVGAATGALAFEFMYRLDSGEDESLFVDVEVSTALDDGNARWTISVGPDPLQLIFSLRTPPSGFQASSGAAPHLTDGEPHHVRVEMEQNGANVDTRIYVDGAEVTMSNPTVTGVQLNQPSAAMLTYYRISGEIGECAVSDLTVWDDPPPVTDSATAALGHPAEPAGRRVERLCAEEGLPLTTRGDLDLTTPMGPQRQGSLLDLLDECAAAEASGALLPVLLEQRDALGLHFNTRESFYNPTPGLVLDYAAGHVSPPLDPMEDDQQLCNDMTAKRVGGGEAGATREAGPLNARHPDDDPQAVGRYDRQMDLVVATDEQLPNLAGWAVHVGTTDEARYPGIALDIRGLVGRTDGAAKVDDALALEPGDVIAIANPPQWLPPEPIEQIAMSVAEQISQAEWLQTWTGVPSSPYRVGVWQEPDAEPDPDAPARYDTAGSELAAEFVAGTDTSMLVATTLGPIWTTDADSLPIDIRVAGVRLRVTAVAGSSSPQTLTVDQAPVNGVAKTIPAGTAVALWQPARYAL